MTAKKQGIELLVTRLEDHAQTLLNSADRISGTAFSKDDAYRQLGHVFIGRLTHELRQIREMRQTRDSWLIARSMLEGSMIFDWVTFGSGKDRKASLGKSISEIEHKDPRARKWFAEKSRESLKRVVFYENQNKDPKRAAEFAKWRTDVEAAMVGHGAILLSRQDQAYLKAGKSFDLKSSFANHFTGERVSELYKFADAQALMNSNGQALAGYHHWNPLWFCKAEWSDTGVVSVRKSDGLDDYRMALEIGIVALWLVCMFVALAHYPDEVSLLGPLRAAIIAAHPNTGPYDFAVE